MLRIALVGYGRMGRAVEAAARERGHAIHCILGRADNPDGAGLTPERLAGAEVAIEFTTPAAAPRNIERLIEAGMPVVTGTTGWGDQLPRIAALVRERRGALLYAPNFSIGVQLFLRAARALARGFAGRPEFDAFILEEHHAKKLDAPSGTALALRALLRGADPAREYPITAIRAGSIPGLHSLTYDGPHETVTLTHAARGRGAFAAGAVAAAEWLPGRSGVFTFEEMLFGGEP